MTYITRIANKRILAKYFLYSLRINYLHWKLSTSRSIFSCYATNDRVKAFDYGYTELLDKPNELPLCSFQENYKLRYSASEMLLLARIMPIIIRDKIPSEDKHYNCSLLLLKILQIVVAMHTG